MACRFRVTGHFEISAQNDPKITLNTARSDVPHIHTRTTPEFQISFRFPLRPAIFELQHIFETSVPNDPTRTLNTKRSTPYNMYNMPTTTEYQISLRFLLRSAVIESGDILCRTDALNDPKMTLNTTRSKVPNIDVTASQISNHCFLYDIMVSFKFLKKKSLKSETQNIKNAKQ